MTLGPLPTFLQSLFRRGGWTHASSGTAVPRKSDGDHCPVSHLLFTSPSGEEGTSCLLPPHPTLCMWTPNTDLAPTGLGRVESLPWGMNIKTLGWLLPMVISSKALSRHDVPTTGLQQQEAAAGEDSPFNRLGRKRGRDGRPGSPGGCQRAWVLCWLLSQSLSCPGAGCPGNPPLYHGSVHRDL